MRKPWLIALTLIVIGLTFLVFRFYPLYRQEGNPLPILSAAVKLTLTNSDIAVISSDPDSYLSKSSVGIDPLIAVMENQGWHYKERMGAGITFANNGQLMTLSSRMYSKYYIIFSKPQNQVDSNNRTITLTATGDILMHNTVIDSGKFGSDYNFDHLYAPIKDIITAGDYASVNLESALAGPTSGYTGYPLFNSPDSTATALKKAGFDLVVTASNHILDRGFTGALRTMDVLRQAGLDTTGTFKNPQEKETLLIKDIRGVKVGYLAYGYDTNGIPVPADKPWFYNFVDRSKIINDIAKMRPNVDIVVLVLHWGVEYSPYPTEQQRKLATEFFQEGADVILGSHPHVIQPMEIMKIEGKDKFVIYSMGNSMGNQNGVERNSGVVINLQFTKDFVNNTTALTGVQYTPTFIHAYNINNRRMFRVIPIEETIAAIQAGKDPYLGQDSIPLLQKVLNDTNKTLNQSLK